MKVAAYIQFINLMIIRFVIVIFYRFMVKFHIMVIFLIIGFLPHGI